MASSLKKRAQALQSSSRKSKDFDPEDDPFTNGAESSESESESVEENFGAGKEHYEAVSKSELRQPDKVELDSKRYASQPVSRAALNDENEYDPLAPEEESEEDPFAIRNERLSDGDLSHTGGDGSDAVDDDDEINSDDAFEDGDEERLRSKGFVFRGSGKFLTKLEDQSIDDGSQNEISEIDANQGSSATSKDDSDIDMDDTGEEDEDDEDELGYGDSDSQSEDDQEDVTSTNLGAASEKSAIETDRDRLRALMSADTAAISASLSQAATADTQKGKAVRQQYQTFDRFLDARIKLQKGLTAANNLPSFHEGTDVEVQDAVKRAEEAALRLFATIESVRFSIREATATTQPEPDSKKRKRPSPPTSTTSNVELHNRIKDLELANTLHRRNILDKWSLKTRSANATLSSRSRSQAEDPVSKLTTVLDAYLLSSGPKLIDDAQTPVTSSTNNKNGTQDKENYITANNISSNKTKQAAGDNQNPSPHENNGSKSNLPPFQDTQFYQSLLRDLISTKSYINNTSVHQQPISLNPWSQTPKIHRQVDRKASKGRKIRYTVHEKMENFMAATGRNYTNPSADNASARFESARGHAGGHVGGGASAGDGDSNSHWTDAAVREFFGSLMGMRNQLLEGNGGDGNEDDDDDIYGGVAADGEVQALRLFRS